jgi:hypothetical protein
MSPKAIHRLARGEDFEAPNVVAGWFINILETTFIE